MAPWTAADIPDLSGRTAVVTGANSGLGFDGPRPLPRRGLGGAGLPGRGQGRPTPWNGWRAAAPRPTLSLARLDLADLASVAGSRRPSAGATTAWTSSQQRRRDGHPAAETADGFEMQFGTNHLGHFALTGLARRLLARPGARVVTVGSEAARMGR